MDQSQEKKHLYPKKTRFLNKRLRIHHAFASYRIV
jgi:hypothetical protein